MKEAPGLTQNNSPRLVIGITGGVGAGKSRIAGLLEEEYKGEVIRADDVAHRLMEPGETGCKKLSEAFGDSILNARRVIDKEKMSRMIFGNPEDRERVNRIVHPLVWEEVRRLIAASASEVIAVESAVADEEYRDICDEIWYVYTSEENRVGRLMRNRSYSREKCLDIMAGQQAEADYRGLCGRVIDNNGSLEEVKAQIESFGIFKKAEKKI